VNAQEQKVFFKDYDTLRAELLSSVSSDRARQAFLDFWMQHAATDSKESDEAWRTLREQMKTASPDLPLPSDYRMGKFHGAVSIMLSARFGHPVGYNLPRLLNVANTAFDHYKGYLLAFGWTLRAFANEQLLADQDAKQTWQRRKKLIREGLERMDEAYRQDRSYNHVIAFLIPEIKEKLAHGREW
jgi:hypothetical protein